MSGSSDRQGENLVLVGFMGAGKTTIARALARRTGYRLLDLDALVEERLGMSIPEIFEQRGEAGFREFETEALHSLVGIKRSILATGGGVVLRSTNWNVMRELGVVVYLEAPWEVLQDRIAEGTQRPLADPELGWEPVRRRWKERLPLYRQADIRVNTAGRTVLEAVAEILAKTGLREI